MAGPFMPGKSQALWASLGFEEELHSIQWSAAELPPVSGRTVRAPAVLFPKPVAV
jgi:methionyl-tRNA synthetase